MGRCWARPQHLGGAEGGARSAEPKIGTLKRALSTTPTPKLGRFMSGRVSSCALVALAAPSGPRPPRRRPSAPALPSAPRWFRAVKSRREDRNHEIFRMITTFATEARFYNVVGAPPRLAGDGSHVPPTHCCRTLLPPRLVFPSLNPPNPLPPPRTKLPPRRTVETTPTPPRPRTPTPTGMTPQPTPPLTPLRSLASPPSSLPAALPSPTTPSTPPPSSTRSRSSASRSRRPPRPQSGPGPTRRQSSPAFATPISAFRPSSRTSVVAPPATC